MTKTGEAVRAAVVSWSCGTDDTDSAGAYLVEGLSAGTQCELVEAKLDGQTLTVLGCERDGAVLPSCSLSVADGLQQVDVIVEPPGPTDFPIVDSCALPLPADPSSIKQQKDVLYATMDGQEQRLDIAWPNGPGPFPLIVFIHGGGWSSGDKAIFNEELTRMAGAGYVAATLNYRLASPGVNLFPAAVQDVRCGLRWLRSQASSYGIDPNRVAAMGYSAGGHLALMLATAADVAGLDSPECPVDTEPVHINGAVSFYGPTDLTDASLFQGILLDGLALEVVRTFLGGYPHQVPDQAALGSPRHHVDSNDAPVLLLHGALDPLVPVVMSRLMRETLQAHSVPSLYLELAQEGHDFPWLSELAPYQRASCTMLAFLDQILQP